MCCYHANHPLLQRAYIERHLDELLHREPGPPDRARIAAHSLVRPHLASAPGRDLAVIVVATPVEEIGRDHDFDWAVVEPSSSASIVQVAGRVNRHRRETVDSPNVALLRYNARHVEQRGWGSTRRAAFTRPGLKPDSAPYPTHDLAEFVDTAVLGADEPLDARLTDAARHPFAALDQAALAHESTRLLRPLIDERYPDNWIALETYTDAPLRTADNRDRWRVEIDDSSGEPAAYLRDDAEPRKPAKWLPIEIGFTVRTPNDWLVLEGAELLEELRGAPIKQEIALSVMLRRPAAGDGGVARSPRHDRSFGFVID